VLSPLSLVVFVSLIGTVHSCVFVRVTSLKCSDSKCWIVASLVFGPLVWLMWRFCYVNNKVSPDDDTPADEIETLSVVRIFF
jgi:hypothetical protein